MRSAFGDHVTVAMEGYVAVVTLNRPPHNFVSVDFLRDSRPSTHMYAFSIDRASWLLTCRKASLKIPITDILHAVQN